MSDTLLSKIRTHILQSNRFVIKIGTNVLVKNGKPHIQLIKNISKQIAQLLHSDKEVILVSSGAICFGAMHLKETLPINTISLRQACAATGQPYLIETYRKALKTHGITCAQLLLTRRAFQNITSFKKLNNCLSTLIKKKSLAIINENDSVATEEIDEFFGDNDQLSAMVAQYFNADLLILLTDVDALYDKNPHEHPDAKRIKLVQSLMPYKKMITKKTGSVLGTGGMYTKMKAASLVQKTNCTMVIAYAHTKNILHTITSGNTNHGTFFAPTKIFNKKH